MHKLIVLSAMFLALLSLFLAVPSLATVNVSLTISQADATYLRAIPIQDSAGRGVSENWGLALNATKDTLIWVDLSGAALGSSISASELADEDWGDVSISSGVASVEDLTISGETAGDILHFNGSNWVRLAIGTVGQVLTVNSGETAPEWDAAGGGIADLATLFAYFHRDYFDTTSDIVGDSITVLLADSAGISLKAVQDASGNTITTTYAPVATPTFTTSIGIGSTTITEAELAALDSVASVDGLAITGQTAGDILCFYGGAWNLVNAGSAGQVLEMQTGDTTVGWGTDDGAGAASIENDVYGSGWNDDITNGASQNAIYDYLHQMDTDDDGDIDNLDGTFIDAGGTQALTGSWAAGDFNITGLNKVETDSIQFTSHMIVGATAITPTEVSYLSGVTSAIQTQLDGQDEITELGSGNWKVYYSNGSGAIIELALGTNGQVLTSNGTTSAPTFETPSGSGLTYFTEGDDNDTSTFTATAPNTVIGFASSITMQGNSVDGAQHITADTVFADVYLSTGDVSGSITLEGITSGGFTLGVLDVAGSLVDVYLPTVDGTQNQFLMSDSGAGTDSLVWATIDFSFVSGEIADTQIADGAVDGGSGGEIADHTIDANDIKWTSTPGSGEDDYLVSYDYASESFTAVAGGAGEINTASNQGAGYKLYEQKTTYDLEFKTITAGTGISLDTATANQLNISISSIDSTLFNQTQTDAYVNLLVNGYIDTTTLDTIEYSHKAIADASGNTITTTYAPIDNPTFTTAITIGSAGISETELEILDGATVTTTELNVLSGIPGTLTVTELGYVDGVTSSIQNQINAIAVFWDTVTNANTLQATGTTDSAFLRIINDGDSVTRFSAPTGAKFSFEGDGIWTNIPYLSSDTVAAAVFDMTGGKILDGSDDIQSFSAGDLEVLSNSLYIKQDAVDTTELNMGLSGIFTGSILYSGSLEIPNSDNPTTDASGELAVDQNASALEVYDSTQTVSVLIPLYNPIQAAIASPDLLEDTITIFQVNSLLYPYGIGLLQAELIVNDTGTAYSIQLEEWTGKQHRARAGYIDTLTTTSDSSYTSSISFNDGDFATGNQIRAIVPSTEVDEIYLSLVFFVKEGD